MSRTPALKRILVTGATGFVGSGLLPALLARGFEVIGAVRTACASLPSDVQAALVGEVGPHTAWAEALRDVDTVVHLAAKAHVVEESDAPAPTVFQKVNVAGTERLAREATAAGVRRFILMSSIGVHGDRTQGPAFDEDSPFSPRTAYARSKAMAERALAKVAQEGALETVVIRPPLVYGPGNPGNLARLLRLIESGLPLPLASIKNRRSFLFLGNLIDALVACVEHPAAAGRAFVIRDGQDISTPCLVAKLSAHLGKPVRLIPFPVPVLKLGGRILGRMRDVDRLVSDLVIDDVAIRRTLEWMPPFTRDDGLAATARWWRDSRARAR